MVGSLRGDFAVTDLAEHKRLTDLCKAVGHVTLVWAQIDINLDFCNVNLRDLYGLRPGWPAIPAKGRLEQKIKFARAHIANAPLPDAIREAALAIINDIDSLSDERHWLIHGAATDASASETIRLVRTHLQVTPTPLVEERHVTLPDIILFGDASMGLCNRLGQFVLSELATRYENHRG